MQNEVFVYRNPMGYTLKKRTRVEGDVTHWENVLKGGKCLGDLVSSILSLPLSFREHAEVNYGRPDVPFPLSEYEKEIVKMVMESV
jgi:hypothetical protein